MNSLAYALPDVKFIFFGTANVATRENEEHVGWVPIKEVIPRCSIIVRMTQHDGLPISPIEFILSGREAVTSVSLEFAHQVEAFIDENTYPVVREKLVKKIRELQKGLASEEKRLKARAYWSKACDLQTFKNTMYELMNRKLKLIPKREKKELAHV